MRRNVEDEEQSGLTLPVRAGMFMELVANPIPNAMADSTPRNLANRFSISSWMSRFPESQTFKNHLNDQLTVGEETNNHQVNWTLAAMETVKKETERNRKQRKVGNVSLKAGTKRSKVVQVLV